MRIVRSETQQCLAIVSDARPVRETRAGQEPQAVTRLGGWGVEIVSASDCEVLLCSEDEDAVANEAALLPLPGRFGVSSFLPLAGLGLAA